MNFVLREHEQAIRMLAKALEDDGYAVVVKPSPDKLPFTLEGYTPDLLATRADDNLIVEVKSRRTPDVVQRYRRVADTVKAHPGWRFLIKTLADTPSVRDTSTTPVTDLDEIRPYLARARRVITSGSPELAIPYLWNAIVALLRHKAAGAGIEFSELSDRSLVNRLYTLGELSAEQRAALTRWQKLRDRAVHDLGFAAATADIDAMWAFAGALLADHDPQTS